MTDHRLLIEDVDTIVFTVCDACQAKPDSPTLCAGCLANQVAISTLHIQLNGINKLLELPPDLRDAYKSLARGLELTLDQTRTHLRDAGLYIGQAIGALTRQYGDAGLINLYADGGVYPKEIQNTLRALLEAQKAVELGSK